MIRYWGMRFVDWLRRTPLAWMLFWENTVDVEPPQPFEPPPRKPKDDA